MIYFMITIKIVIHHRKKMIKKVLNKIKYCQKPKDKQNKLKNKVNISKKFK